MTLKHGVTQTERRIDAPSAARVWEQVRIITCTAITHDSLSAAKVHGCVCPISARSAARYEKRRRCGLVKPERDAAATRRQLQALAIEGWPSTAIAEQTGLHDVTISEIRRGATTVVYGTTAEKINEVHAQLAGTKGPSERTRRYAERQGWTLDGTTPCNRGEIDDLDEIAIERAIRGEWVKLTKPERDEAVRLMTRRGINKTGIAQRLHLSGTVATALIDALEEEATA